MKKKLRLKLPFRILLSAIAVILIVTLYFPVRSIIKLVGHNYSFSSSVEILSLDLYDDVIVKDYSETLDKIVKDKDFNIDNYESYMNIKYQDRPNFLQNVNKLLELKYTVEDINNINSKVSDSFYSKLFQEYIQDISKYLTVKYFKEANFDRYRKFFNGSYEKTILYVNIGLDKDYYTDTTLTDDFSVTMLVNKYHGVSDKFSVPDLTQISEECSIAEPNYMSREAAEAFETMCRDAKDQGYDILANSTYRDMDTQQETWDTYLNLYGIKYNEKYVTRPGYSEHHTGLSVDIKSKHSNIFKESKEYQWCLDNSYKYGFIHRYPESKVNITGISSESWHFRYVGVEIATYIYENNLSYEEYYAMFLDK